MGISFPFPLSFLFPAAKLAAIGRSSVVAPRAFWTGYLKFSLVSCAVSMMPAVSDEEKVRFHVVNARTGDRVVTRYVDAVDGTPVEEEDEVKGYPRGEGDYILLEDEELESVALESVRTIDIDVFAPAGSIDWIWYDRPHYLMPGDQVGEEAYSVIRAAMEATKTVGIAKLVLYRRERAVMIEPRGKGLVLWTLRYGEETRDERDYFGAIRPSGGAKAEETALVEKLIDQRMAAWSPALVSDPVQEKLLDIIAAKRKAGGKSPKSALAPEAASGNVVSIMDALRRSLRSEKGTGST